MDTVTTMNSVIDTFVTATCTEHGIAPRDTRTGLDHTTLVLLKMRVETDYIDIDTVAARHACMYRVIHHGIVVDTCLARVERDEIARTELVVPRLYDTVGSIEMQSSCKA